MRTLVALVLCLPAVVAAEDPDQKGPLTVRVYPVADLVADPHAGGNTQLSQLMLLEALDSDAQILQSLTSNPDQERTAIEKNLAELTDLLQTATVPDDWDTAGGPGRMSTYSKTLSLIVRQHEQGHTEVCELLEQLRRENSLRVVVTIEMLEDSASASCNQCQPMTVYGGVSDGVPPYAVNTVSYAPANAPSPYRATPLDNPQQPSYAVPAPPTPAISPTQPVSPTVVPAQPVLPSPVTPVQPATPDFPVPATTRAAANPAPQPTPATQPAPPIARLPQTTVRQAAATQTPQSLDSVIQQMAAKHGPSMNEKELAEFRKSISGKASTTLRQSVTMSNGHSSSIAAVPTTAVISPDRRYTDVHIRVPSLLMLGPASVRIPDGETKVVQLNLDDETITFLVKAEIQIPEEEEELIPASSAE